MKIALVGAANRFESGGERGESLIESAKQQLTKADAQVDTAEKMVWDAEDALSVIDQFIKNDPDILVILHVTWICDTIQYMFVNSLDCPVILWAVPYTETFSAGCIQHFGSILHENGYSYDFVYGLPDEKKVIDKIIQRSKIAAIAKSLRTSRIALLGPRQTWRVANSQDMVKEEWDFSRKFGTTIVHIEMSEVQALIQNYSDKNADDVIEKMQESGRLGTVKTSNSRLKDAAKTYLSVKELSRRYGLTAAAAECYPLFCGMMNLPSSWLADEGFILDTEGDIGHTYLMTALSQMGNEGPIALAEIGAVNESGRCLDLAHEGSSAHSLAENPSLVVIQDGGDGIKVGLPYKPSPLVTAAHMIGTSGSYRMMIFRCSTGAISHDEWVNGGSKLMARLEVPDPMELFNEMIKHGIDHHLLIKQGDTLNELSCFCDYLGIEKVLL